MSACDILGLDPLYVANEGKLLAIVAAHDVDLVLKAMKSRIGGTRVVDMLSGEQLLRIC
jgi:hydrogenase expression/formation protein HypE